MTRTVTHHAFQRFADRLRPSEQETTLNNVRTACRQYGSESLGVIAYKLRSHRGQHWGMSSNGDYVVAIVRNGQLVTAYLRRGTQSFCTSVTRTRVLVDMTGNLLKKPIFS